MSVKLGSSSLGLFKWMDDFLDESLAAEDIADG